MDNQPHAPAKIRNFSLAFQQMCSMVAIGQTKGQEDTLRELILQTLALLPEEKITNEETFSEILNSLFGLQIADHEIKFVIERLMEEKAIVISETGSFVLSSLIEGVVKTKIDNALALENNVREGLSKDLQIEYPNLSFTSTWTSLRKYLAGAFLRHGIQAVALLNPSFELDNIHSQSLTELLNSAVDNFHIDLRQDAKRAISDFVATTGQYPERSKYIAQLADGAFSYFSLATDPKVADRFRQNLIPLVLFLDTNFLFGILGLTINPQVDVSNELIKTIKRYGFPFTLNRHIRTQEELLNSVAKYEFDLSHKRWSKSVSRAAVRSRLLSGVEIKYHQSFIDTGIDIHSFFRPFHHADIILNEKSINLFNEKKEDLDSQNRIATLIADYEDFLTFRGKEKPYKILHHDMTVLDVVRQLRSNVGSTLDAGALLITCDYSLYAFDWEASKKKGILPCTVLPNLFWQVSRPFIPSDENFSLAFAQTFAIPEFRTINSGAAEACSKMVNIMAGYNDFPEETAVEMLSNDILIDQLRKAQNDEEFQNYVEEAIVKENAQLVTEKNLLTEKYEKEKTEKNIISKRLEENSKQGEENLRVEIERRTKSEQLVEIIQEEKFIVEEKAKDEKENRQKTEEQLRLIYSIIKAVTIGIVAIIGFEFLIYRLPWFWLISHSNSYGLQVSSDLFLLGVALFIFVSKWRKYIMFPILLPVIFVILQLLGGPK